MRLRLTYEGPLPALQRDPVGNQKHRKAGDIHTIRKVFHTQLKYFWETNEFLSNKKSWRSDFEASNRAPDGAAYWAPDASEQEPLVDIVADQHVEGDYRFVPLARSQWNLECSLDILFLRHDPPGSIYQAGDIDNRIKALLDALRKANNQNELRGHETPSSDENPFFVLLEDDDLVTNLNVRTDRLLVPPKDKAMDSNFVKLVISAEIHPNFVTMFNLSFL